MRIPIVALAALLLAAAAPAGAQPQPKPAPRQCFATHQVRNFASDDDRSVNFRVGAHDVYRAEFIGGCPDIDWSQGIGILVRGGGSRVCSGLDLEIVAPSPIGPRRCAVRAIRKLTPAEIEALPPRARP